MGKQSKKPMRPTARKKGKQQEAGEWEEKTIYIDRQGDAFHDPQFAQLVKPIDLVDWEEVGPPKPNSEIGNSIQRYKRFKAYGPPSGGGLA
jgi:hypothetical protein